MRRYQHQFILISLTLLSTVGVTANAVNGANSTNAGTLMYISPNDYNHSVRLLHPYYDYWFAQGPLLEPVALKALQKDTPDVGICKANETADTIIRIKPHLFYNPQMRVFHSKIVATAYSGGGQLLGTYVGEAQQLGLTSVDNATQAYIQRAYKAAMQNLMTKLSVAKLAEHHHSEQKLPCGMIGAQEEPKISFY